MTHSATRKDLTHPMTTPRMHRQRMRMTARPGVRSFPSIPFGKRNKVPGRTAVLPTRRSKGRTDLGESGHAFVRDIYAGETPKWPTLISPKCSPWPRTRPTIVGRTMSGEKFRGQDILTIEPEAFTMLTEQAFRDISHLLRPKTQQWEHP